MSNTVPNMTGSRQSYVQPDLGPGAETRKCCRLRDELNSIFLIDHATFRPAGQDRAHTYRQLIRGLLCDSPDINNG